MSKAVMFAIVIVVLSCSLAGAELYQWVDKNGVVTFKDTPPPAAQKKVKVYTESSFDPAPGYQPPAAKSAAKPAATSASPAAQPAVAKKEGFQGTVEVYVTSWCGYCKKAIRYLQDNNIPYVAYDIEKDSAAHNRHKQLGGRGVPLIIIGSHKMNGYSARLLDSYLKEK